VTNVGAHGTSIPHQVVLAFLWIAAVVVIIVAWSPSRSPVVTRGRMFHFLEGVIRWHDRVIAYAFVLVTDRYPPFRLIA
jgi:hypothetical protein